MGLSFTACFKPLSSSIERSWSDMPKSNAARSRLLICVTISLLTAAFKRKKVRSVMKFSATNK